MPLVTCPDCGKQVSTQAAMCPQCGKPVPKKPNALSVLVALAALVKMGFAFLVLYLLALFLIESAHMSALVVWGVFGGIVLLVIFAIFGKQRNGA
jgi:uncharacterized membrane protein YvbJ